MPTFTKTLSAGDAQRLIDAYCGMFNYQDTILDVDDVTPIPNPETRSQFAQRMLTKVGFKDIVKAWERQVKIRAAEVDPIADITVTDS